MLVKVSDGLLHFNVPFHRKDLARAFGAKFDKVTKTYHTPVSQYYLDKLYANFSNIVTSKDTVTQDALARLRLKSKSDEFLTSYLNHLRAGMRPVDFSDMRFKEGFTPFEHQKIALDFVRLTDVLALFWDCGLGKTFVVCQWMQYLVDNHGLTKALVLAPKSALHTTWMNDLQKFTWLDAVVLDGGGSNVRRTLSKTWKRKSELNRDFQVYIMNYEGVASSIQELSEVPWGFLAVDESTKIKNPKAKRTSTIIALADRIPKKVVMAGLPAPNGMMDIYAQLRCLSMDFFGANSYVFMGEHYNNVSPSCDYPIYVPKQGALGKIQEKIVKKGLRLELMDSGVDLPGNVRLVREAVLDQATYAIYAEMKEKCLTFLKSSPVYAQGIAQVMKLRQITSGFLIDANGVASDLTAGPAKLEVLKEVLADEIGEDPTTGKRKRAIIWCNFTREYAQLKAALGDRAISLADFKKPLDAITKWKNWEVDYLIANPQALGYSVTMTEANHMVWYSYDYSSEKYYQANRRMERLSQNYTAVIYHIVAVGPCREGTIDSALLKVVRDKLDANDKLLSVFERLL